MTGTSDEEMDRAKLVDRLASEYTQLKYLVEKAQSEGCKIVDAVTPVLRTSYAHQDTEWHADVRSAWKRSRAISAETSRLYFKML